MRMIADKPTSFPVVAHDRVWRGAVFDMDEDRVQLSENTTVVRHYVAHTGAVAIVALRWNDGRPQVALVNQYRHPVQATLWEIPAGLLDKPGERPLDAAKRELKEETDLKAQRWDVLVDFFTSPGGSTEALRIYLAREVSEVPLGERFEREDEEALMQTRWVNLEEAVAAIHSGQLHNPSAVMGLLATKSALDKDWAPLRPSDAPWMRSPLGR